MTRLGFPQKVSPDAKRSAQHGKLATERGTEPVAVATGLSESHNPLATASGSVPGWNYSLCKSSGLKLLVLLLNTILLLAASQSSARAQTRVPKADTQSWNDFQLAIPLSKTVDFTIQGTLRIGDNLTKPVDGRWGFGASIKLNKYLSFNPFYFHREARPPNGRHEREDRATLGATLRFPVGKFTLSERNWFERRWRAPQVNAWRYRNAVSLEHPFKIGKTKFTFVVGDEVFYDWSLHGWVRNRFQAGASHVFNKHFTLYVYGMRQNDGRSRPGDINIIGTALRFRL